MAIPSLKQPRVEAIAPYNKDFVQEGATLDPSTEQYVKNSPITTLVTIN